MKRSQHSKSFWSGKGFYLALTLVIAGAATASFLAINSMMSELGTTPAPDGFEEGTVPWPQTESAPAEEKQEGVPVAPRAPSSQSTASRPAEPESAPEQKAPSSSGTPKRASKPSAAPSSSGLQPPAVSEPAAPGSSPAASAEPPAPPAPQFVSPHTGSVLQPFSGDELVYNETMRDWRTHNGTDIAVQSGDSVKAPAAGEVTRAENDLQWGGVVEITEGERTVRVCGLGKLHVKKGQQVAPGDVLGKAGELPAESALAPHIHVEFLQGGRYEDPKSFF